jgi:protein-S-isoprenylcysteine O-methyltransferase Ste14
MIMRKPAAAVGTAAFFVVAPGTVVGLVPWLITHWRTSESGSAWRAVQAIGVVLIVAGLIPLIHAFVQFAKAGGTPMPAAPTQRLVVTGFNRYLRNPMYAGLVLAIIGQALLFASLGLLLYAAAVWLITASFVRWYEEPTLTRQFGADYLAYRHNVPAWWPRLRPWTPHTSHP